MADDVKHMDIAEFQRLKLGSMPGLGGCQLVGLTARQLFEDEAAAAFAARLHPLAETFAGLMAAWTSPWAHWHRSGRRPTKWRSRR